MKGKICQYLSGIMKGISVEEFWEWMEVPPEEKMGDLALPCYGLAKKLRQDPKLIAAGIVEKLNEQKENLGMERAEHKLAWAGQSAWIILRPILRKISMWGICGRR